MFSQDNNDLPYGAKYNLWNLFKIILSLPTWQGHSWEKMHKTYVMLKPGSTNVKWLLITCFREIKINPDFQRYIFLFNTLEISVRFIKGIMKIV